MLFADAVSFVKATSLRFGSSEVSYKKYSRAAAEAHLSFFGVAAEDITGDAALKGYGEIRLHNVSSSVSSPRTNLFLGGDGPEDLVRMWLMSEDDASLR